MNTRNADKDQWLALAERCEKAKNGDWKLDGDILTLAGGVIRKITRLGLRGRTAGSERYFPPGSISVNGYPIPDITASLDVITALIEREFPGIPGDVGIGALAHGETTYHAVLYVGGDDVSHCGDASTPALALCGAFCRAMAGKAGA
jgi:hypothetical protein